jgi:hypothetical protein
MKTIFSPGSNDSSTVAKLAPAGEPAIVSKDDEAKLRPKP